MNLKLFIENRSKQKDGVAKLCRRLLCDPCFKGSHYDQLALISSYKKKYQSVVDDFFIEFKEAQK